MQYELVRPLIDRIGDKPRVFIQRLLETLAALLNVRVSWDVESFHDQLFRANETDLSKESVRAAIRRREFARKYWWLDGGYFGG